MMTSRAAVRWFLIVLVALGIVYIAYDKLYNKPLLVENTQTFISEAGCFAMEMPSEWILVELPTGTESNGVESRIQFTTEEAINLKKELFERCKKETTRSKECRISQFKKDLFFSRYTGFRALPFGGVKRTIQFEEQKWYRQGPLNSFLLSGRYIPNIIYSTFDSARENKYVFEFHKQAENNVRQYLETFRFLSDDSCPEAMNDINP